MIKGGSVTLEDLQKLNLGLPIQCSCCDRIIKHREMYFIIKYKELEFELAKECYYEFVKAVKEFNSSY